MKRATMSGAVFTANGTSPTKKGSSDSRKQAHEIVDHSIKSWLQELRLEKNIKNKKGNKDEV